MSEQSAVRKAARKRYWQEEDGRAVLRALEASGESRAAFARRTGIHPQRLRWWAERLSRVKSQAVRFHPVRVAEAIRPGGMIEIHLAGCRVVTGAGVRVEDLRSVLEAVRGAGAC